MDTTSVLDRLVTPLGDCLTPESAKRVLLLKADPEWQARVEELATRHREGTFTSEEATEYAKYVSFSTLVAIMKSKARQILAESPGKCSTPL